MPNGVRGGFSDLLSAFVQILDAFPAVDIRFFMFVDYNGLGPGKDFQGLFDRDFLARDKTYRQAEFT